MFQIKKTFCGYKNIDKSISNGFGIFVGKYFDFRTT